MTGVLFVAVVVIVFVLIWLNGKVNKLTWENALLKRRLDDIGEWLRQHMGNAPAAPPPPAQPPQQAPYAPPPYAPPSYAPYTPPPAYPQAPPYTPPSAPYTPLPAPYARPAAPQAAANTPPMTYGSVQTPAPRQKAAGAASAGASGPSAAGMNADSEKKAGPGRMENWFGRNVLGVAASVLFFIGLIVFAVWAFDKISETVKIVLMYLLSMAVTVTGVILTVRRRNTFTLILTGCGCGLLFISLLLTHIYFGRLNDVATFSLLLVWLAAALALARQLNSTMISLVAHVGMGISLCFAYAAGLRDDKLVVLLVYQAASIAVIVVGNILCCRKTYRFGLFLSVVMTLIASGFMYSHFIGSSALSAGAFSAVGLSDGTVAAAFFAQFLCASFLSYLLAISTTRLDDPDARLGIHVANKLLWLVALCVNVLPVVYRLAYAHFESADQRIVMAAGVMAAVGIAMALLHALLSLFMSLKLGFDGRLETLSVLMAGCTAAVLLLIVWGSCLLNGTPQPRLPWLLLPAGLLLLTGLRGKNRAYCLGANILLGLEWGIMALFGFHELTRFGTAALPLGYMALYAGLVWLQWALKPAERRQELSLGFRLFMYFFPQVTTFIILAGSGYRYWGVSLLLALTAFNLLLRLFRYDRGHPALTWCLRAMEGTLLAAGACVIAFMPRGGATDTALYAALAILCAVYAFFRVPATLGRIHIGEDIFTGVKFTVLVLAVIQGFTDWFDSGYILSLAALATALSCLAAGYARKARGLTGYGLMAALLCSAKILLFDVIVYDGLSRIAALFCGSLLFFVIYLLYDRIDDKSLSWMTVLLRIFHYLFLAASAIVIGFSPRSGPVQTALTILLTALSFVWAFLWTPKTLGRSSPPEDVAEGVKLTVLVLACIHGYTDWFADAYALSLVCMLTSLACVIAGFIRRAGSLRLYGLVLTMACVLKLVTWDVAGLETLLRILSLIGGGVICFVISAIYSYSVKHLTASDRAASENASANPFGDDSME